MRDEDRTKFAAALLAITRRRLTDSGATITAEVATTNEGHELRYISGATEGTVVLSPICDSHNIHYKNPAIATLDEPEVTSQISIWERWSKARSKAAR
jgi:hypothetical protein